MRRTVLIALLCVLTLSTLAAESECDPANVQPTPEPTRTWERTTPVGSSTVTPTPLPVVRSTPKLRSVPTPTFTESFNALMRCDRIRLNMSMGWAQFSFDTGDLAVLLDGRLEKGDEIKLLSGVRQGVVHVQVYPQDGRLVGAIDDQVYINWGSMQYTRTDQDVFTCVDSS